MFRVSNVWTIRRLYIQASVSIVCRHGAKAEHHISNMFVPWTCCEHVGDTVDVGWLGTLDRSLVSAYFTDERHVYRDAQIVCCCSSGLVYPCLFTQVICGNAHKSHLD